MTKVARVLDHSIRNISHLLRIINCLLIIQGHMLIIAKIFSLNRYICFLNQQFYFSVRSSFLNQQIVSLNHSNHIFYFRKGNQKFLTFDLDFSVNIQNDPCFRSAVGNDVGMFLKIRSKFSYLGAGTLRDADGELNRTLLLIAIVVMFGMS